MTDEDERMDRARRIREMREGSRSNDDEQPADEAETADDPDDADQVDDADSVDNGGANDDGEPADDAGETVEVTEAAAATEGADAVQADAVESQDADASAAADAGEESDDAEAPDDAEDGDGSKIHVPGAEVGDVDVDVAEMAAEAGLDAVDADDEAAAGTTAGSAVGMAADAEASATEQTRVLEFTLGSEQYCLDIDYVEEIVKRETVTRVPNTPEYVDGVVDLRGQITTILDPKVPLGIDEAGSEELIVVFDPDQFDEQGAIGWLVDDVRQVTPVTEDEVNESPVDDEHINGVVDRDGDFVIWTSPEVAIDEASG